MNRQFEALTRRVQLFIEGYHLEKREKIVLFFGIIIISVFMITELIVTPYIKGRARLTTAIATQQNDLTRIKQLQEQYLQQQKNKNTILEQVQQRTTDFSLFTFLETQSRRAKIKQQIKYMKPSTVKTEGKQSLDKTIVEIQFKNISLRKLIYFLELIESDKHVVFIRKITIQGTDTPGLLNITAQIVTFSVKKEVFV